jgi:hypothetical protein
MPWSDFANADVDDIVEKLTTDEAILLTAGVGFWHTHEIARLGIPAVKVSDGPNGMSYSLCAYRRDKMYACRYQRQSLLHEYTGKVPAFFHRAWSYLGHGID